MGSGDADLLEDGNGGGGIAMAEAVGVSCSICLEVVTDNGDRSWAKLQCGHQFHLDCIGSAFNVKGSMQCPNCRKIEKGQWLYANGSRPMPEFSMDEWAHDEDLYDLSYSEMSFGVHWCPFSGLTRLPSTLEEGEFSSTAYHDLLGHHAIFAEHTLVASTSHPCPYIAYIAPIHPSSSTSSGTVSDVSSYNNHWSGPSIPSEVPNSYAFPSMDVHYHNWDHSPFATNSHIGGADQSSIPPAAQRTARNSSDMPRPGMHPYIFGHSSGSRAPSSATSSVLPHYPGTVGRPRDRVPSLQAYFQQSTSSPPVPLIASNGRRSSSHRGLAQVAPIPPSSDQSNNGFYFFSSNSSGSTFQEVENPVRDRWEHPHHPHHHHQQQQQQPSFPLIQVDRDSIWGPFQPPGGGSETTGIRSGSSFRQRHGTTERMPSQNRS
ncbi:hypothetical protein ACJIZ3_015933 [Penstemon smallii]|uniref:RING-type domain-containing protein n=1 Tax=Penstemon smallii TaxID=265156 RepID=A0ABD3RUS2_9LAMI